MQKGGWLNVGEAASVEVEKMRDLLRACAPLSALQLCYLIDNPGDIFKLGRYVASAQDQLDAIGNVRGEAAPFEVAGLTMNAAQGEDEALAMVVDWIKRTLPESGESVPYVWIASRLLLAFPANIRQFEVTRIQRTLARARALPEFSDWWSYGKLRGRKATFYTRPKNSLASLDL
jgi:hypothetical protein